MAYGGGIFTVQNKTLPGGYINFVSAAGATATLSERGISTMPLTLSWGPAQTVLEVTAEDFAKNTKKLFGYSYTDEAMKPLRELFCHSKKAFLYRLNKGKNAENKYAKAKYSGTRGNDLRIVIEKSEGAPSGATKYDVSTYLGSDRVDVQKSVEQFADLTDNDFIQFKSDAVMELTAGTPLTGGEDGEVTADNYQQYLSKMESYGFHAMGCDSNDPIIKALFVQYAKRMREECGVKFQLVLHRYEKADYEGAISVENGLVGEDGSTAAVYYVTGAEAGCSVNQSLTNHTYTGEYDIHVDYSQAQLEQGIQTGKLLFHRVGDTTRILKDRNTLVSITEEKGKDFQNNQVVRVLDQIGNDIGALFRDKYLGKIQNDDSGRIGLWSDIVQHHRNLETIRAIENFNSGDVVVTAGEQKESVVVSDTVQPVCAMEQLYMTVVVQ